MQHLYVTLMKESINNKHWTESIVWHDEAIVWNDIENVRFKSKLSIKINKYRKKTVLHNL